MFGAMLAAAGSDDATLEAVAREFSPRIDVCSAREIALDLSGVGRLFGDGHEIAAAIRATAADRRLQVRVAIAGTRTAARLLVHHRAGLTVIDAGTEAAVLAPLPLTLLRSLDPDAADTSKTANAAKELNAAAEVLATLRRWGLRTLGDFAALPPDDVAARLGQEGVRWQRLARGEDPRPLVPAVPEERFEQALDLEWPIDGLEPLSFVLGRLMDPLERHLEQRDRGAAVLHVRLHLVKGEDGTRPVHERTLQLPAPMRDARTLRTLALLDLESHPPAAAIERVVVAVDPTPGRIVQYSLLTRPLPSPEQISTLMARLHALMGDGRCGAPALVDSWQPGAFAMQPFHPREAAAARPDQHPRTPEGVEAPDQHPRVMSRETAVVALRRFRFPVPARVHVERGRPSRVLTDRRGLTGGRVEQCAGPWRTSGQWWTRDGGDVPGWDRDEWDVTLADGATYRVFRERDSGGWFLEGIVD